MNNVTLMGRLTRDPEIRTSGDSTVARYTLAVDRRFAKRDGNNEQQTADFISIVAFGKSAEFAEKYLKQGTKIALRGRIQTGSYTNKDGQKVYTTDVVAEEQEFAESKKAAEGGEAEHYTPTDTAPVPEMEEEGYMDVDPDADDLPFKK